VLICVDDEDNDICTLDIPKLENLDMDIAILRDNYKPTVPTSGDKPTVFIETGMHEVPVKFLGKDWVVNELDKTPQKWETTTTGESIFKGPDGVIYWITKTGDMFLQTPSGQKYKYTILPPTTPSPEPAGCVSPYMTKSRCSGPCEVEGGSCEYASTAADGERCYECKKEETSYCPSGQVEDIDDCEDQCPGTCVKENVDGKYCYSCKTVEYSCPGGTVSSQSSCQSQCPQGDCVVSASEGDFKCYECKLDCSKYCSSIGYSIEKVR